MKTENVFNNHRGVDFSILEELDDYEEVVEAGRDPTCEEFEEALTELTNDKSTGENGMVPNLLKALKGANRARVFHFIMEFWRGNQDYESWHRGLLVVIFKGGKKDSSDPNNYRGINLMDVVSKIFSKILNKRLFMILDRHCTRFQFGSTPGIGCREAIFTLKTLLGARRNHGLSIW